MNEIYLQNKLSERLIKTQIFLNIFYPLFLLCIGLATGFIMGYSLKELRGLVTLTITLLLSLVASVIMWLGWKSFPDRVRFCDEYIQYVTKIGKSGMIRWEDIVFIRPYKLLRAYPDFVVYYRSKENRIDGITVGSSIGKIIEENWYKYLKERETQNMVTK